MKVVQAFAEVNQKVWGNPKVKINKDNIFSGTCPLLFRSYVSDHLLTLSNSFLASFSSLLLLSQALLISCCPSPEAADYDTGLVLHCDGQNFTPMLQAWGKAHCSCLDAERTFPFPLLWDRSHKQAPSCLHKNAALPPTLLSAHPSTLFWLYEMQIFTPAKFTHLTSLVNSYLYQRNIWDT